MKYIYSLISILRVNAEHTGPVPKIWSQYSEQKSMLVVVVLGAVVVVQRSW
jgi:hypothetical protein